MPILQDLVNEHSGVLIGVKKEGYVIPHIIQNAVTVDDGYGFVLQDANTHMGTFTINIDDPSLVYEMPVLGFINTKYGSRFLSYTAKRQWKKLTRPDNIIVYQYTSIGRIHAVRYHNEDNGYFQIFNPNYSSFNKCLDDIVNNEIQSVAFSKNFALISNDRYKYPLVQYKSNIVGYCKDDTIHLPKKLYHLNEEVSQYAQCKQEV